MIHHSPTSIAFIRALKYYLSFLLDDTPSRLCISRHRMNALHQLVTLVTINMLQLPMITTISKKQDWELK